MLLLLGNLSLAQRNGFIPNSSIADATLTADNSGTSPASMRFAEGNQPTVSAFFDEYRTFFNVSSENEFRQVSVVSDKLRQNHYRFSQYYRDVEILGAQYILHEKNGSVHFANGRLLQGLTIDVIPTLTEAEALNAALNDIAAQSYMWQNAANEAFIKQEQGNADASFYPSAELKITSAMQELLSENCRLVYRFDIYAENPFARYYVDVDAHNGQIIAKYSRIHDTDVPGSGLSLYNGTVNMTVDQINPSSFRLQGNTTRAAAIRTYDMHNGTNYNAASNFTASNANGSWDAGGVSGHFGAEQTYDYFYNTHNRNSLDNSGFVLNSYIHANLVAMGYPNNNNAFWDGSRMTYGDGDGVNYNPLISLDVVGHELTHGVTEFSANLVYQGESGALNESFSDIFGNLVEFEVEGDPGSGTGSWRIGEDFTVSGLGFRNMANPSEFGDPDTYAGLYWASTSSTFDNGGVHINSGVQNFWFYLLAEGGIGTNDYGDAYNVTGIGITDASEIAYNNLVNYLTPASDYLAARNGSIAAATDLFGNPSQQVQSVTDAWDAVRVHEMGASGVLVWDGKVGITDFSGAYIYNYLINAGFDAHYTAIFPETLEDYDAVFLSFGNYGSGSSSYIFNNTLAGIVEDYLNSGGKLYLEGGDALGWDQRTNVALLNLFGISSAADGATTTINGLSGQSGAITNGMTFTSSTQQNNTYIDTYTTGGGIAAFNESGYGDVAVQYSGSYGQKTFCFSYALGELQDATSPATKDELLAAIVTFFDINPDAPLPVSLTQFTAKESANSILLEWQTQSELQNTGFIIERKEAQEPGFKEIASFQTEGTLIGAGNSNTINDYRYTDNQVSGGKKYQYNLFDVSINGLKTEIGHLQIETVTADKYVVYQNYPNPFNPVTNIRYQLAQENKVSLKIYDTMGRLIETLVDKKESPGVHSISFDASRLASGIYFYILKAGTFEESRKMLLLR